MSATTIAEPEYVSRRQAARLLDVSLRHIGALIARGEIPAAKLGRLVRIPKAALAPAALATTHETPCQTLPLAR